MTLYRLLIRLLVPGPTRRAFGEDMVRLFRHQREDVRATGGSLLRFYLRAAGDLAAHGSAERLATLRASLSTAVLAVRQWRRTAGAARDDLRYAFRLMRRGPGVSVIAVLTLALGIGGNTAIFSAVDAVLLRPLPYDDPGALMTVWEKREAEGVLTNVVSPADFLDWSRMNGAFEAMAGFTWLNADLTGTGEPVRLVAGAVSPAFFDIFRIAPSLGRNFRSEETVIGNHRVVILGHPLWQGRFGSDPGILGTSIVLNAIPHEVIGVLPAAFQSIDPTVELWTPLALEGGSQPPTRVLHFLEVYARLKPGVTLERARAEMDRVGRALQAAHPEANRNHGAHVVGLAEHLRQPVKTGLLLLLGAVAFVLLIACVNVANLLLAKSASRRRELAVRAALGAGRMRLASQALCESLLLALLGGAVGLAVAYWGIGSVRALTPEGVRLPGIDRLGLDTRVLLFTLGLSAATGLVFGLLPALQAAHQDANGALRDGGRSMGGVRRRVRTALVVTEIALATLLLVGTGLTLRSFEALLGSDAGLRFDGTVTALVALPSARYDTPSKRVGAVAELEERFGSIPGVRAVGATSHLPLSGQNSRVGISIEGVEPTADSPTRAHPRGVTTGYLDAMGIRLIAGRSFSAADHAGSPHVAIVNQTMARQYWPGESALGRRVRLGGTESWREIVGVVHDVRHWGLDRPVAAEIYMPFSQYPWSSATFVLATDGPPAALAGAIRARLRDFDRDLPLSSTRTMQEVAARSVASRRASMILLATFGVLALVLAGAGIYAVTAHLVAQRTDEIGVRMSLGARPADIFRLVLREGIAQAAAGVALGITGAVLVMGTFRALLYDVSPADPLTLLAVSALLVTTAVIACYWPARKAMRVDPVEALRSP